MTFFADVDRVGNLARRRMARKQLAERDLAGTVDDEADVLVVADGPRHQDGGAVHLVAQLPLGHQDHAVGGKVRAGGRGGPGKGGGKDEQ